jgi:hypothetical protein
VPLRDVGPFGDFKADRVRRAWAVVILRQTRAELGRFHSDDRIAARVVVGPSAEHLGADDGFLDLVGFPMKFLLDDVAQKVAEALVVREPGTGQDSA